MAFLRQHYLDQVRGCDLSSVMKQLSTPISHLAYQQINAADVPISPLKNYRFR